MVVERHDPIVRVELLGPLRLTVDGTPVDVAGPKRRAVLVLLAAAAGRTVSVDALVEELWPADDVVDGRQAVQSHVSRLRRDLGPGARCVHSEAGGYRLDVDLDLSTARELWRRARGDAVDPDASFALAQTAIGLWRGPVLPDLTEVPAIAALITAVGRLHDDIVGALVERAVALGRADEVVDLAARFAADDPLRESGVIAHMRALAATGAAADALRLARGYRRTLAENTGLDPSARLDELEREIAVGAIGPAPLRRRAIRMRRSSSRLVGRAAEVASVVERLATERLVTLVGPGGVGKTRVAQEVMDHLEDAIVVPLAGVTGESAIPHVVAAALQISVERGDVLSACLGVLAERTCVLVIDNCEHLLGPAADLVSEILSACDGVRVLTTSREPLGLPDEFVTRLRPLPVPGAGDDPAASPAVTVFCERAARVRSGRVCGPDELTLVAEVVRRLDGLPLAIELAAGRLSTMSLDDLAARLDRALDLLAGSPTSEARHLSVRSTLRWSYELLGVGEQRLLRHLAAFPDGLDLRATEWLARRLDLPGDPAGLVAHLVDASLVERGADGSDRFTMLGTMSLFGRDQLRRTGEERESRTLVVDWAIDLAHRVDTAWVTTDEATGDAALRAEISNLRAAWLIMRRDDRIGEAAELIVSLFPAIAYRDLVELRSWASELGDDPRTAELEDGATVLSVAAEAAYQDGDLDRAERLLRLATARRGDRRGDRISELVAAQVSLARGDHDAVIARVRGTDAHADDAELLGVAALATAYTGSLAEARALNRRAYADARSPTMRAWEQYIDGEIAQLAGETDRATEHYLRSIELAQESGATFVVGVATVGRLSALTAAGRVADALRGYREVIRYFARAGNWTQLWVTVANLSTLLGTLGDIGDAARLERSSTIALGGSGRPTQSTSWPPPADSETAGPFLDRDGMLQVVDDAIDRHLGAFA